MKNFFSIFIDLLSQLGVVSESEFFSEVRKEDEVFSFFKDFFAI